VAVGHPSPCGSASSMSRGSLVVDHGSLPPPPLGSLGQMGCGGRSAAQGCQGRHGSM
jgi:hypothetical protein